MISLKVSENKLYSLVFFGYLVLLGTTLKVTFNLESISTILTGILITLPFILLIHRSPRVALNSQDLFVSYLGCALILPCFINLFIHGISYIGIVQTLAFIFPWMVLLCVVFSKEYISRNQSKFWKWFNSFLVILVSLGLLEYFACFYFGLVPSYKETPNGSFFVGYTTVFHALESGLPHFRFYGPFGEPGDFAIWGSVLIVYNLFRRNYLSVGIFSLAIFLSASPSVVISLLVAFGFYLYKSRSFIPYTTLFFIVLALWYFYIEINDFINDILIVKQGSLEDRADSFFGFFGKFSFLVWNHPFGIPFFATSSEATASEVWFSGNFTPILAFERGGIIAFIVYILFLIFGSMVSFMRIIMSRDSLFSSEIYLYFFMILPFIVQRHALFEFGLFPLLFSAIFLRRSRDHKTR